MKTFRSIDELVKSLDREKVLLKEMFNKRKSPSFRMDYALELTEYKEERIRYLIDYGVIRDSGNYLELEDVYLNFFEEILQVNEEINVSFVKDYLDNLNENIDYYLKENNEQRRYGYQREVKRCLKRVALSTVKNVIDLKRNTDNTYKNEPNYQIKLTKLKRLDEKRRNIAMLITKSEELIDVQQPTFFHLAMDVQMRNLVADVKMQLNDSYHNLIEIEKQIIHYLNLIAYQNRIFEKVKRLKYLRDQFLLEENTDILHAIEEKNPVWMETQPGYRIKLSIQQLRNSGEALEVLKKVIPQRLGARQQIENLAGAIPDDIIQEKSQKVDAISLQTLYEDFEKSDAHLFQFVMNYDYEKPVTENERISLFCQMASLYPEKLDFTDEYETTEDWKYPLVFCKKSPQ